MKIKLTQFFFIKQTLQWYIGGNAALMGQKIASAFPECKVHKDLPFVIYRSEVILFENVKAGMPIFRRTAEIRFFLAPKY